MFDPEQAGTAVLEFAPETAGRPYTEPAANSAAALPFDPETAGRPVAPQGDASVQAGAGNGQGAPIPFVAPSVEELARAEEAQRVRPGELDALDYRAAHGEPTFANQAGRSAVRRAGDLAIGAGALMDRKPEKIFTMPGIPGYMQTTARVAREMATTPEAAAAQEQRLRQDVAAKVEQLPDLAAEGKWGKMLGRMAVDVAPLMIPGGGAAKGTAKLTQYLLGGAKLGALDVGLQAAEMGLNPEQPYDLMRTGTSAVLGTLAPMAGAPVARAVTSRLGAKVVADAFVKEQYSIAARNMAAWVAGQVATVPVEGAVFGAGGLAAQRLTGQPVTLKDVGEQLLDGVVTMAALKAAPVARGAAESVRLGRSSYRFEDVNRWRPVMEGMGAKVQEIQKGMFSATLPDGRVVVFQQVRTAADLRGNLLESTAASSAQGSTDVLSALKKHNPDFSMRTDETVAEAVKRYRGDQTQARAEIAKSYGADALTSQDVEVTDSNGHTFKASSLVQILDGARRGTLNHENLHMLQDLTGVPIANEEAAAYVLQHIAEHPVKSFLGDLLASAGVRARARAAATELRDALRGMAAKGERDPAIARLQAAFEHGEPVDAKTAQMFNAKLPAGWDDYDGVWMPMTMAQRHVAAGDREQITAGPETGEVRMGVPAAEPAREARATRFGTNIESGEPAVPGKLPFGNMAYEEGRQSGMVDRSIADQQRDQALARKMQAQAAQPGVAVPPEKPMEGARNTADLQQRERERQARKEARPDIPKTFTNPLDPKLLEHLTFNLAAAHEALGVPPDRAHALAERDVARLPGERRLELGNDWRKLQNEEAALQARERRNKWTMTRAGAEALLQQARGPASPGATPGQRTFSYGIYKTGTGHTPVIDAVTAFGGVTPKGKAQHPGGEYDAQPTVGELGGFGKIVFTGREGKGKNGPAEVAQALFDQGVLSAPSADELWSRIKSETGAYRDNVMQAGRKENAYWEGKRQEAEAQGAKFEKDALKPKADTDPVNVNDLKVGDEVEIAGVKVKVTAIDPDTDAVDLSDGRRYGVQRVEAGTVIYAESVSTSAGPTADKKASAEGGGADPFAVPEPGTPGGRASVRPIKEIEEMRRLSERLANDPRYRAVSTTILGSPEVWKDGRQNLKDLTDRVAKMTPVEREQHWALADKLGAMDAESTLTGVVMAHDFAEAYAAGDLVRAKDLALRAGKTATTQARMLRQLALFHQGPEASVFAVETQHEAAYKKGLRPEDRARLLELARAETSSRQQIEAAQEALRANPTPEQFNKIVVATDRNRNAMEKYIKEVGKVIPPTAAQTLLNAMRGGVMTTNTGSVNVWGNAAVTPVLLMRDAVGSAFDMLNTMFQSKRTGKPVSRALLNPWPDIPGATAAAAGTMLPNIPRAMRAETPGARWRALVPEVAMTLATGVEPRMLVGGDQWAGRIAQPIVALLRQFRSGLTPKERANLAMETVLAAPLMMLRVVQAADVPFDAASRAMAANQLARIKGLSGMQARAFKLHPDAASEPLIEQIANEYTFKEDGAVSRAFVKFANMGAENHPWLNLLVRPFMLFARVPGNLMHQMARWSTPLSAFELNHAMRKAAAAKTDGEAFMWRRAAAQRVGDLAVAGAVWTAGMWLLKNNLINATPTEMTDREREIFGISGIPAGHVNVSGLARSMNGEDGAWRTGDRTRSLLAFGPVGAIWDGMANGDLSLRHTAGKEGQPYKFSDVKTSDMMLAEGANLINSYLDMTFARGAQQVLQALKQEDFGKIAGNMLRVYSSVVIPNQANLIARANLKSQPNLKIPAEDITPTAKFMGALQEALTDFEYRAWATKQGAKAVAGLELWPDRAPGRPAKLDFLGREIPMTPPGAQSAWFHMFDATKAQEIRGDVLPNIVQQVYRATNNQDVLPPVPTSRVQFYKFDVRGNTQLDGAGRPVMETRILSAPEREAYWRVFGTAAETMLTKTAPTLQRIKSPDVQGELLQTIWRVAQQKAQYNYKAELLRRRQRLNAP